MLTVGIFIADRYEVLGKIGAGGMSDVYKAKDHVLGRFVAIKVLKQEFSEDVNFVTKFRTEAQSAAGLEHPNIVNIYDVGSEDGMHYIVMEYVEGITLKTYIEKKGQLNYKEAISIAIQVGRGIEAAHNKHIVHRDIKPQNIIISTEGKVKVTDFGIARAATSNTINSDVMGSVHYASPEQARNGYVDGKSDIYSLGIVMYEMVTGRVPFDGDTTVSVAIQHLQEEMVTPRAFAPELPISLEKIILKCTQKNADRRYQGIEDLLLDLKKALISPDEDFVTMVPVVNQNKTRVIGQDELDQITKESGKVIMGNKADPAEEEEDDEEEDEEEDGILNPKMEKAVTIMGIAAAVVIVAIIVVVALSMFDVFKFGGSKKTPNTETETKSTQTETDTGTVVDTITMINVTNMTFDEAKTALEAIGLKIEQEGVVASDDVETGKIVSQSVDENTSVAKNTTIKVTVSSGADSITVIDVTNNPEAEATKRLEDAGFSVQRDYEYNENIELHNVIRTEPSAGTSAKKGDTVKIILSQGIPSVKVPNVLNKPEQEAWTELENAGLTRSGSTTEYNDEIPEGNVISQSIVGGKSVDKGSSVTLVISLGKKTVYYRYTDTISVPTDGLNYTKATLTLYDDQNNIITKKNVKISEFPYPFLEQNIPCSSGVLMIIWTYLDEDGNKQTINADPQNVTFIQQ